MKSCQLICLCFLIFFSSTIHAKSAENIEIANCPKIGGNYRAAPYLKVAQQLQAMGQKPAIAKLRTWSASRKADDQVVILCCMLFQSRKNNTLRRPMFGAAVFFGDTNSQNWPLEPITIHEGVPILITYGYSLHGRAERSTRYLNFCIKNCNWHTGNYQIQSPKKIEQAINDFLAKTNWPTKLSAHDIAFFKQQAKKPVPAAVLKRQQELIEAALYGDAKKVRALLKAGVDVNARYGNLDQPAKKLAGYAAYPQYTALHAAALNAQNEIITILIAAKADVNAKAISTYSKDDITPLYFAVSVDQSDRQKDGDDCALQLIKAGANVNVHCSYYDSYSSLHHAVSRKRIRVVNALIAAGANVNIRSGNGQSPLHLAKEKAAGPKIIAALLKAGANPKQPLHIENDVFIRFPKPRYQFTLAQAAKGISIPYDVIVKRDIQKLISEPQTSGGGGEAGPSGLIPLECLSGNKQFYGIVLSGDCISEVPLDTTLHKGVYRSTFKWKGYNWRGEECTDRPKGPQFPPGKYTLEVSTIGTVTLNGQIINFKLTGKTEVVITK